MEDDNKKKECRRDRSTEIEMLHRYGGGYRSEKYVYG